MKILQTNNKKVFVSKHAQERMERRVLKPAYSKYNKPAYAKCNTHGKIKYAIYDIMSHVYYSGVNESGYSRLFTKGYIEYVLAETDEKITVVSVIFHGNLKGKKRLQAVKDEVNGAINLG